MHLQPGNLKCSDCGSPTSDPSVKSTINSKFLFIEFSSEMMERLIMYDRIKVGGCWYSLKGMARSCNNHFTCAIHNQANRWQYSDDLCKTVLEFPDISSLNRHFPNGWFFTVFEFSNESSYSEYNSTMSTISESVQISEYCNIQLSNFTPKTSLSVYHEMQVELHTIPCGYTTVSHSQTNTVRGNEKDIPNNQYDARNRDLI